LDSFALTTASVTSPCCIARNPSSDVLNESHLGLCPLPNAVRNSRSSSERYSLSADVTGVPSESNAACRACRTLNSCSSPTADRRIAWASALR
jgi:hypothetical protein